MYIVNLNNETARKNTTRTHKAKFLCQFCAIILQKQAIFGDMWQ